MGSNNSTKDFGILGTTCVVTKEEIDVSALDDSITGAVIIDVSELDVNVVDSITTVVTIGVSGVEDSITGVVTISVSTLDDIVPDDSELVAESTIGVPTLDVTVDS